MSINFKKEFINRKQEFHSKVKDQIITDLNVSCCEIEGWDSFWSYADGCFIADSLKFGAIFLLRGDFEPYVFDTLAVLPEVGYPAEYSVSGVDDVPTIIESQFTVNKEE